MNAVSSLAMKLPDWVPSGWAILDNAATKWLFLVLALVMPLASLLTWAERRQSAMMQDRLGPNRANIGPIKLKGILHFVADALKMIFKEDFVPANVHRGLFALAPILALAPVFIAFAIIPFGPTIFPHEVTHTLDTTKDPAKLRGRIDKAMAKLLKNYPPPRKN